MKKKLKRESWSRYASIMDYKDIRQEKVLKRLLAQQETTKVQPPKRKRKNAAKKRKKAKPTYQELLKTDEWKKRRKEILDKKGYICSNCGKRFGLEVHHLRYINGRKPWEYEDEDLIVLCDICHKKIHGLI